MTELSEQFQAALVAYDEGLSDDKVLAAAVWRRFYTLADDVKPEHIERLVHFIRHQVNVFFFYINTFLPCREALTHFYLFHIFVVVQSLFLFFFMKS